MEYIWMATAITGIVIVLILVLHGIQNNARAKHEQAQIRLAGRRGEVEAFRKIEEILAPGDHICTNVHVLFEGQETELDYVIVNRFGVFIIEVKNFSGRIRGGETDRIWKKTHRSRGGKLYVKNVENPIRQVKRQTYILARFLRKNGFRVWVQGYVYFLNENRPVKSRYLLANTAAMERAVHSAKTKRMLDADTVNFITTLFRRAEQTRVRNR